MTMKPGSVDGRLWACAVCCLVFGCQGEPLVLTPEALPNGIVGRSYTQKIETDSTNALSWSVSDGTLPPGASLGAETGRITATFTEAGPFTFTLMANEGGLFFRIGERTYTLTVIPKLEVDASLPTARQDEAYSRTFAVSGGVTPYTFELVGLPGGLTFNTSTGTISGTPVVANQSIALQLTVIDSGDPQQSLTRQITLVVKPLAVNITTTSLLNGKVGVLYIQQVQAAEGLAPYQWAVTQGVLPAGLTLNLSTGVISGIPTTAQTKAFTITVTDDDDPASSDAQALSITIDP